VLNALQYATLLTMVGMMNQMREALVLELGATMQRIKELQGRSDDLRGFL